MWKEENNKLKNSYTFKNFKEAFSFMKEVADIADRMDHHPWWSNMYNEVSFELCTHDAGNTITSRDRRLAEAIDKAAEKYIL
ncbi:MAG: 4a-hydroxytetrahydrobiopterin dehydratase [Hymenobacteraceae bacterium]|nr:4a-hydroxytetrahydrobiopterin dehydratase [Hymenobacteraceae bacterium]MDX5397273.1 4a-hydroxytetrahydrobiopterin dehydratase [Hymenobacteraceae bacterium]MDX5444013.1 4a-hydroxytetrahydrobiopterin dehydratase [Hymenobacteraceae bacterium]MDX5513351.1 4a-hydroxytetrahydrobiopterin dehydratase [Hymenobacteraceae bacterium]